MNQVSRFMAIISMSLFIAIQYKDKLAPSAYKGCIFI